jgi:hypothetical protein
MNSDMSAKGMLIAEYNSDLRERREKATESRSRRKKSEHLPQRKTERRKTTRMNLSDSSKKVVLILERMLSSKK